MMNISKQRIAELELAERKLNALEAGGVDNWEWYSESLKEYNNENEITERTNDFIAELSCAFGECAYEPSERGAGIAFNDNVFDSVLALCEQYKVTFKDIGKDTE